LFSFALVSAFGCEADHTVVTPDADDDTTVIEERGVDVTEEPATPPPTGTGTDTGVNVDVGGDRGVNVDVNPGATNDAAPADGAAPSNDATQNP
jgi:hypothetical protein